MGYRREDGTWYDSCLEKLHNGEAFFVLRAQDKLAPLVIRTWAVLAWICGRCSWNKIKEAWNTAKVMGNWHHRKYPD